MEKKEPKIKRRVRGDDATSVLGQYLFFSFFLEISDKWQAISGPALMRRRRGVACVPDASSAFQKTGTQQHFIRFGMRPAPSPFRPLPAAHAPICK